MADSPALPARERILLTAHDLFYRDGIRATGIDRVIAEAGVTKVTFYRHFPSKNELVLAFLAHRHERWMAWFREALGRHAAQGAAALPAALAEWFEDPGYRGCAFVNSVGELGGAMPEVLAIAAQHKADMAAAIAELLPPSRQRTKDAELLAMAADGAMLRAQYDGAAAALQPLERLVKLLVAA